MDPAATSPSPVRRMTELPPAQAAPEPSVAPAAEVQHFSFWYGPKQALFDINIPFVQRKVTALIGPSGCGKSTLLRSINRMNDLIDNTHHEGTIRLLGEDVYHPSTDVIEVRKKCGMVFQRSNPFPKSIFENVVFGLRIDGVRDKQVLQTACERSLRSAALWDEVKDRLHDSALNLSGGQQQRLCIARAVATNPTVLLMDEPCSALDPVATVRIEELIHELSAHFTVVIVTHNMQQAARVSDYTAFFHMGKLVEFGETRTIFTRPGQQQTEDYITGKFG